VRLHSLLDIAERELDTVYEISCKRHSELRGLYLVALHGRDDEGTECAWEGGGFTPDTAAEKVYEKMADWVDRGP
jgi:hypothetical protein